MEQNYQKQSIVISLFLIAFSGLVLKAAQLQLFDESYKSQANRTTLVKKIVYPSRGLVYDRNGKLLVFNNSIYNLNVTFRDVKPGIDTSKLCNLLNIDIQTFRENITKNWRDARFSKSVPFTFLSLVKPEVMGRFVEHLHEFDGFEPVVRSVRSAPHPFGAHVLGFMGEVDKNDLTADDSYDLGDYIGKTGIEKQYENILKGEKGTNYILKDNLGREVGTFENGQKDIEPIAGIDLITTIDLDLQAYLEELMINKRGSIVAIEPSTGEILAMVSSPNYDPNALNINANRGQFYTALLNDSINKPLIDRSLNAKYPPGSIFKPILSLIALQEGLWSPYKTVSCPGYYQYKAFRYGCHPHSSPLALKSALQLSCNSYFFQMLRDLVEKDGFNNPEKGMTLLHDHLTKFGLGTKTGVDLPGERTGFVPDVAFYDKLYNTKYSSWRSTYIMSIGIGQGELELTTLQIANLAAILANRGYYITPHIVRSLLSSDQQTQTPQRYERHDVDIDAQHFVPVVEGMRQAIQYGTATSADVPGLEVCGKTGTAQNPFGKDHSVFFAFAPKDNPKIAIAVFVENAGFGAQMAAPITGLALEKYLNKEISPYKKSTEDRVKAVNLLE